MLKSSFIKREQAIYTQIKMADVYIYEDLLMKTIMFMIKKH